MAVWLPKHENTLIVELTVANLYDERPYGGSVEPKVRGGLYKRLRYPAAPPPAGICG